MRKLIDQFQSLTSVTTFSVMFVRQFVVSLQQKQAIFRWVGQFDEHFQNHVTEERCIFKKKKH
jgi:hypothetical protein